MKERTTIYLTPGLRDEAKVRKINISGLVERALSDVMGIEDDENKLRQKEGELIASLNVIKTNLAKYDAKRAQAITAKKQLLAALKPFKEYFQKKKNDPWPNKATWLESTATQFNLDMGVLLRILETPDIMEK